MIESPAPDQRHLLDALVCGPAFQQRCARAQEREAFLERGQRKLAPAKIAEHRRQIEILEGQAGFCDGVLSSMG
jgi:hypothetical protein